MKRPHLSSSIRFVVSLGLLGWLVCKLDGAALGSALGDFKWAFGGAAILALLAVRALTVWKWRMLLGVKGIHCHWTVLFRVLCVGNFLSNFLPTTTGADGVRVYGLSRIAGKPVDTASSIVVERVAGAVSLALLSVLSAVWAVLAWGRSEVACAVALPAGIILVAAAWVWHPWLRRQMERRMAAARWLPGRLLFWKIYEAVYLYRGNPEVVWPALAISTLTQMLRIAEVYLIAQGMGLPAHFSQCLAVVPPVLLISMLPVSIGGWGVREGAFLAFFEWIGLGGSAVLGLALLWRMAALLADMPGVLLYAWAGLGARQTQVRSQVQKGRWAPAPGEISGEVS